MKRLIMIILETACNCQAEKKSNWSSLIDMSSPFCQLPDWSQLSFHFSFHSQLFPLLLSRVSLDSEWKIVTEEIFHSKAQWNSILMVSYYIHTVSSENVNLSREVHSYELPHSHPPLPESVLAHIGNMREVQGKAFGRCLTGMKCCCKTFRYVSLSLLPSSANMPWWTYQKIDEYGSVFRVSM